MTVGGWTAGRVFLLWPAALVSSGAVLPTMATVASEQPPELAAVTWPVPLVRPAAPSLRRPTMLLAASAPSPPSATGPASTEAAVAMALAALIRYGEAKPVRRARPAIPPPVAPTPLATAPARLAGSAWLLARGGANGTLLGGRIGGSQAGARLTYALGEARRIALSARIATPLSGRGREGAVGIDWQPTHMPLHIIAEQRFSFDGGRGGPTLMVVGGINPTPIVAGFKLEGYAEAGAIKRDQIEAFGDGAVRLTRPALTLGPARLDFGVGAWGAGQRGARRLDVGPTIGAMLPVASHSVRITADWRQRIAGDAAPGSGPALSIGTDF